MGTIKRDDKEFGLGGLLPESLSATKVMYTPTKAGSWIEGHDPKNLQDALDEFFGKTDQFESRLDALKAKVEVINTTEASINQQLQAASDALQSKMTSITTLASELTNKVNTYESLVDNRYNEYKGKLETLLTQISDKLTEIENKTNEEINRLKAEGETLKGQILDITTQLMNIHAVKFPTVTEFLPNGNVKEYNEQLQYEHLTEFKSNIETVETITFKGKKAIRKTEFSGNKVITTVQYQEGFGPGAADHFIGPTTAHTGNNII